MLKKPDISDDTIIAFLHAHFGLDIAQVSFLPVGYEKSAVYRVESARGKAYFLKLRQGAFAEIAVAVPTFLHSQGIRQVMAPLATNTNQLHVHLHGFCWTLYPFFEGKTGFELALSKRQWIRLGRSVKAIHTTILPAGLGERVPKEDFSAHRRMMVKAYLNQAERVRYEDPIAAAFAGLLRAKRDEISVIVERAGELGRAAQQRDAQIVLCHSDLHARNVLVGADDKLVIVDWDEPILAPKERDLMFVGGGVGGIWNTDQEARWFYQGYGPAGIDLVALAYYRYERIVADIAEYSEQIFGRQGSREGRQKGLRLVEQFLPDNVVEIAHRSYQQLSEGTFG
jgi:spectinomycin phosphotransferase